MSMCTIWACARHHVIINEALPCLFSRFHLGRCLSCGTDGAFKAKGSLLWAAYSSLDPRLLTAAIKVSMHHTVTRQQSLKTKIKPI